MNIMMTIPMTMTRRNNGAYRQTKIRHISECATGKRKTAGGYIWSYNSTIEEKE